MGALMTQKQFEKRAAKFAPKIKILGKYKGVKYKIRVQCKICGYKWSTTPRNLMYKGKGKSCPKCLHKRRSVGQENFVRRMHKLHPTLKVLGKYKNCKTNIKMKCLICGYIWNGNPNDMLYEKSGCPICSRQKGALHHHMQKTQKQFVAEIKQKHPTLKVIGHYVNCHTKIKMKCLICGYIWSPLPSSLSQGWGCPSCSNRVKLTPKQFEARLKKVNPTIKAVTPYITRRKPIKVLCLICGHTWTVLHAGQLIYDMDKPHKGSGCPFCNPKRQLTQKEAEARVKKANPYLRIVSKYINNKSPMTLLCLRCHHKFTLQDSHEAMEGPVCPYCDNRSRGEEAVQQYLRQHHYKFKPQYKINKCRFKLPLPFDYAVLNKDGSLKCLIEYEGFQHYLRPGDGRPHAFYTDKQLIEHHKRDMIKRDYCIKHHIMLIYVNHSEYWPRYENAEYIQKQVNDTLKNLLP